MRDNFHLLPKFRQEGKVKTPRYCPSIETKLKRFPDRDDFGHVVWLEPEGLPENTSIVYPAGISTSMPEEIQLKMLRTMSGLSNVEMLRPGYVVEYDYVDPRSLHITLETKKLKGLFLAGQINGMLIGSEATNPVPSLYFIITTSLCFHFLSFSRRTFYCWFYRH